MKVSDKTLEEVSESCKATLISMGAPKEFFEKATNAQLAAMWKELFELVRHDDIITITDLKRDQDNKR